MKICRKNALKLWEMCYGSALYAEDFHGNLMCRDGYGNPDFYIYENGERIFGGSNAVGNLLCTNIATNDEAGDRITFWIDDSLYQVRKAEDFGYRIVELEVGYEQHI